ncbi:hypothetical protein [Spirosoma utsteinense]|uniref:hypothetical protein n=1 Tax=Spirosoma utsteinense TaxID=2585773 RepID=UPI00164467CE|nr:hypothetical protein [Spirosoma utsteinense]MBC3785709.1 hypothetical protein [Spirosoma utsteinense]
MLNTFDKTFDFTFARAISVPRPNFPILTGGDGGGGPAGAVLPFSVDPNVLPSCLRLGRGQGWERWAGVPISRADYLMPFVAAVPMPDAPAASAYCVGPLTIIDADSGETIPTPSGIELHYLSSGNTLYILHSGSALLGTPLPEGNYRVMIGTLGEGVVSDVFSVKCGICDMFQIRLGNDVRIGDLLYGSYDFEQRWLVEGELSGPSYDYSESKSGDERTAASVKKSWTLRLEDVTENIADALAMVSLHRLVEVSTLRSDGTINRTIQSLLYSAKTAVTANSSGGYDIELTLPVSATDWKGSGASGTDASCAVLEGGAGALVEVMC